MFTLGLFVYKFINNVKVTKIMNGQRRIRFLLDYDMFEIMFKNWSRLFSILYKISLI